ncbi:MAG: preprotein translocase subunit YajC [Candidatus Andeanibacterium colombiense]|uniref:Sec translocon accessory complex subunit YajC n=1 Tax=Candidatus Andeanibacterium colombiense TaxID=3121345 RepID=A0AAJ5X665_9SPHN|nr:MAG: preprotein translocase subunit YajC [Sphingomonadaceae bacterium]
MLDILSAAAAGAPSGLAAYGSMIPIVGMVAIFWFLIIRPQMRQQKEHKNKVAAMKRGDQVVTAGGIVGKVTKVDDNYAELEIAQGVKVKVVKQTIADLVPPAGAAAND